MREENLKILMGKLGMTNPERRNAQGTIWLNTQCPLAPWTHKKGSDRKPSFGIVVNDAGTSIFSCYGCKQKGSTAHLIRLLQNYRKVDYSALFAEAEEGERGLRKFRAFDDPLVDDVDELVPLNEAIWDGMFDPIEDHREASRFMVRRRVTRATCHKLALGFDPDKRRIVFPVRHTDGLLYGFSGRTVIPNHEPKVLDYGGLPKRSLILGSDRWRPGFKKVVVEGLFAFARLHEIGLEEHADIGAVLGSELTPEKAQILKETGDCTVLMFDPDEAGDTATFGRIDPMDNDRRKIETSAIGQLWGHVPLIVPEYPDFPEGVEPDVDNLTLEQALEMIGQRPWRPDKDQRKALDKGGKGWSSREW